MGLPTLREQVCLLLGLAAGTALTLMAQSLRGKRGRQGKTDSPPHDAKPQNTLALARRVTACKPLPIKVIAAEVSAKVLEGKKIVNMSQGVPCLPIFEESARAMTELIDGGRLPYSAVPGINSVREACAHFVNDAYGLPARFAPEHVIVTAGGIQACHLALGLVLERPDDVVLATVPAYPLYQMEAAYYGATFAPMAVGDGRAAPTPQALVEAFEQHRQAGRQVRAVILCAPNNPTGAVLSSEEAQALAAVLEAEMTTRGGQFIVLLDEVYIGIESGAHVSLLQAASPALARRICLVLSASKGLGAMPGARAAWVTCADPALVLHMAKLQSCGSGNASTVSQVGLGAALDHCRSSPRVLAHVRDYYLARTRKVAEGINALGRKHGMPLPLCAAPAATFYVWADFSQARGVANDKLIFERLLDLGVAVIPGSAFCMAAERKLVRLSCAQDSFAAIDLALSCIDIALGEWVA